MRKTIIWIRIFLSLFLLTLVISFTFAYNPTSKDYKFVNSLNEKVLRIVEQSPSKKNKLLSAFESMKNKYTTNEKLKWIVNEVIDSLTSYWNNNFGSQRAFYVRGSSGVLGDTIAETQLLNNLANYWAKRVFFNISYAHRNKYFKSSGIDSDYLKNYLNKFYSRNITPDILLWDTAYIFSTWRQNLLSNIDKIVTFQSNWTKFGMIHLDIEPHSLAERSWDSNATWMQNLMWEYIATLSVAKSRAWSTKICADIHRLYTRMTYNWRNFVDVILDNTDCIAVMDFVTNTSQITSRIAPFKILTNARWKILFNVVSFESDYTIDNSFYHAPFSAYTNLENMLLATWVTNFAIQDYKNFSLYKATQNAIQ